jgi:hypothetical protein
MWMRQYFLISSFINFIVAWFVYFPVLHKNPEKFNADVESSVHGYIITK